MMLRDILVHIESTGDGSVADFAVKLALKHDARLTGLALTPPPPQYYDGGGVIALPAVNEIALAAEAQQIFDHAVADATLSTSWREAAGPAVRDLALHARFADLVVFNHGDPNSLFPSIANGFILTSGQPALLVPQGWHGECVANRVLVAWNSTRESARALHDALPLLTKAEFGAIGARQRRRMRLVGHGALWPFTTFGADLRRCQPLGTERRPDTSADVALNHVKLPRRGSEQTGCGSRRGRHLQFPQDAVAHHCLMTY